MRLQQFLDTVPRPNGRAWTQATFGEAVGVRQQAVSRWCEGKAIPRRHHMNAILRITGGVVAEADFYAQANDCAVEQRIAAELASHPCAKA